MPLPTARRSPVQGGDETLRGAAYRRTYQSSVISIVGSDAPPVRSAGTRFFNVDRWTVRVFTMKMCEWAKANPECVPTRRDVAQWVRAANSEKIPRREIVIAATPESLVRRTALALTAGAYHEAFHTRYSCRRQLDTEEMARIVLPRWAKVPDWSKYHKMLQEWSNIAEDIFIERWGRVEYPGTEVPLHDLQDFILHQEAKGVDAARAHSAQSGKGKGKPVRSALSIIMSVFRDVGLGYVTDLQKLALEGYREENNEAVEFVLGKGAGQPGPLTGLLKDSIAMPVGDDTACIRVAMDVVGVLYAASSEEDPANDEDDDENQPGDPRMVCPDCGAPGSKLVIRPKSDGRGGKVKGKGVLTCTECGYQDEVDLSAPQAGGGGDAPPSDPKFTPKFEGFDPEDLDGSGGSGEGEGQESDGDADGSGGGSSSGDEQDGDDDGDADGSASGSEDDGDGDDDESGKGSSGDDGDEQDGGGSEDGDADGSSGDGSEGGSGGGEQTGPGSENGAGTESDTLDGDGQSGKPTDSPNAGGHHHFTGQHPGNDWSDVADESLEQGNEGGNLLDNNSALGTVVEAEVEAEERREGGVKQGEDVWRPYEPGLDEVRVVEPSRAGKDHDRDVARALYDSVRKETSYLRARLRMILRAMEMIDVVHGLPKGKLSNRRLVNAKLALRDRQIPRDVFMQKSEQLDTSIAAAVVMDESGSMDRRLKDATRVMCAITEPLDALGCPVQVTGFRDGNRSRGHMHDADSGRRDYHRYHGIVHDVFKGFDEPLRACMWRFANTIATGGTPMADGIQFGLDSLNRRSEGHRILFVVTDGEPNYSHRPIIARQIRLAKEAGIHIVGVGLGHGAQGVTTLFDDHVWTDKIEDMPKALIAKINQIVDTRVSKRGRKMKAS